MKPKKTIIIIIILIVLSNSACAAYFKNPAVNFKPSDLEGIWKTQYGANTEDQLIVNSEGSYKQIYEDSNTDYTFETQWNKWWVENSPDGRKYIHLEGARYFLKGIEVAERDGMGRPCTDNYPNCGWDKLPFQFYNPYTYENLAMTGELVLTILTDLSGNLVLHHMWTSGDAGFPIIGGNAEIFRR